MPKSRSPTAPEPAPVDPVESGYERWVRLDALGSPLACAAYIAGTVLWTLMSALPFWLLTKGADETQWLRLQEAAASASTAQ